MAYHAVLRGDLTEVGGDDRLGSGIGKGVLVRTLAKVLLALCDEGSIEAVRRSSASSQVSDWRRSDQASDGGEEGKVCGVHGERLSRSSER